MEAAAASVQCAARTAVRPGSCVPAPAEPVTTTPGSPPSAGSHPVAEHDAGRLYPKHSQVTAQQQRACGRAERGGNSSADSDDPPCPPSCSRRRDHLPTIGCRGANLCDPEHVNGPSTTVCLQGTECTVTTSGGGEYRLSARPRRGGSDPHQVLTESTSGSGGAVASAGRPISPGSPRSSGCPLPPAVGHGNGGRPCARERYRRAPSLDGREVAEVPDRSLVACSEQGPSCHSAAVGRYPHGDAEPIERGWPGRRAGTPASLARVRAQAETI
jgi:hypothetical protein